MEVASGEYGSCVDKLVAAVEEGKCDKKQALVISNDNGLNTTVVISASATVPDTQNGTSSLAEKESASKNYLKVECDNSLLGGSSESLDDHCHSFPTSTWTQFRILFVRTFFSIIRDETLTKLRVISHIAIGILLGALYWDIGNEASKVYNNR